MTDNKKEYVIYRESTGDINIPWNYVLGEIKRESKKCLYAPFRIYQKDIVCRLDMTELEFRDIQDKMKKIKESFRSDLKLINDYMRFSFEKLGVRT